MEITSQTLAPPLVPNLTHTFPTPFPYCFLNYSCVLYTIYFARAAAKYWQYSPTAMSSAIIGFKEGNICAYRSQHKWLKKNFLFISLLFYELLISLLHVPDFPSCICTTVSLCIQFRILRQNSAQMFHWCWSRSPLGIVRNKSHMNGIRQFF